MSANSFIRQSIFTSLVSYLGVIIGYFNVIWLQPKVFSPEQLGIYRAVIDISLLMVPFAQAGLRQGILRFFPYFTSKPEEKKNFIGFILSSALVSYLIFLSIILLFEKPFTSLFIENASGIIPYLKIVLLLVLILVYTWVLEAFSQSNLRIIIPNFLREVYLRLFLSLLTFSYFFEWISFDMVINGIAFTYFSALILLMLYLSKVSKFSFNLSFHKFLKKNAKKIYYYSLFSVLASCGSIIVAKVDSLMITSLMGLPETAVYTTSIAVASVIEMPRRAISQLSSPVIASAFKRINLQEIKTLYEKSSINQFIIGFLLLIGIWANADNLYYMMPNGDEYKAGKYVILLFGLGKLINMVAGINGEIIGMSKHFKFNIKAILILAIFVVGLNLAFIPSYGMNGAALASLLSMLIFNVIKYIYVLRKYKIQPLSRKTLIVLIIGVIAYGTSTLIPQQQNAFIDLIIRSAVITIVFSLPILKLEVSKEVNQTVTKIFKRIINR